MKIFRFNHHRCSLLIALLLMFTASAMASDMFSSFNRWTDDVGEQIWGFESNCPERNPTIRSIEIPYVCSHQRNAPLLIQWEHQPLSPEAKKQLEEWIWVQCGLQLRLNAMFESNDFLTHLLVTLKNEHPSSPSTIYTETITRLKINLAYMATLKEEFENAIAQINYIGSCSPLERDCRDKSQRRIFEGVMKKRALIVAMDELMVQTPLLGYQGFEPWIERLKNNRPLTHTERQKVDDVISSAITDAKQSIATRIDEYTTIIAESQFYSFLMSGSWNRNLIDQQLHNLEILNELVVSTSPEDIPGLEQLGSAKCRLENRILKDQAIGQIRSLSFNSALIAFSAGIGAYFSSARIFTGASYITRGLPLVAADIVSSIADLQGILETQNRCDRLKILQYTNVQTNRQNGEKTAIALRECHEELSDRTVMALLSVFTAGFELRSILRARVIEKHIHRITQTIENAKKQRDSIIRKIKDARTVKEADAYVPQLRFYEEELARAINAEARNNNKFFVIPMVQKYNIEPLSSKRTIRYLEESERANYLVHVKDGKLYLPKNGKIEYTDEYLMDTTNASSIGTNRMESNKKRAIFVMDEDGNMYASLFHKEGEFHHSSFLAGKPVAGAGELIVENGVIKLINDFSGHYYPIRMLTHQVVGKLRSLGVTITNDIIKYTSRPDEILTELERKRITHVGIPLNP